MIKKGAKVILTGRLKSRTYEDREGNTRMSLDVTADTVGLAVKPQRAGAPIQMEEVLATPF
jgi:single-stranded DNA-binding protein